MSLFLGLLFAVATGPAAPSPIVVAKNLTGPAKTCRIDRSVSTRIVRRVCRTEDEWDKALADQRDKLKIVNKSQTTEAFKPPVGN